jgi:hypothetical protein
MASPLLRAIMIQRMAVLYRLCIPGVRYHYILCGKVCVKFFQMENWHQS